jgi:hypothetical protein
VARSIIYLRVQKINYDKNKHTAFFWCAATAVTIFPQQIQISLLKEADAFGKIFVQSAAAHQFCHPEV